VIASGFPENYMKNNLFANNNKENPTEEKGKIFNTVFKKEEKREAPIMQTIENQPEEKKQNVIIEDDDEWGSVPAFLRRSKLK
jgi:hypothetical protein